MVLEIYRTDWDGYNEEERALRSNNQVRDVIGIPLFGLFYLRIASLVSEAETIPSQIASTAAPSTASALLLAILALLSSYVLFSQSQHAAAPTKDVLGFLAQQRIGDWVYLTRHCITLQAWHQVFTVASFWSPWLSAKTHGVCILIAALSWFVTIQYFLLVAPNPDFLEECRVWKERGVQFKEFNRFLHIPALVISVFDVALRSLSVLQLTLTLSRSLIAVVFYVVFYLSVIVTNFSFTKAWPYSFLSEFGTDITKWASFVAQQLAILWIFASINWGIVVAKSML